MGQLYRVKFAVHYEDVIDNGDVLLVANDEQSAIDFIRMYFEVPASQAIFDVRRVKPSIWQLDRHEIVKNSISKSLNKKREPLAIFNCFASPSVRAANERSAWRKLGSALIDRSSNDRAVADKWIQGMELSADRKEFTARSPAIERQAIYTHPQFFSGGATRGK